MSIKFKFKCNTVSGGTAVLNKKTHIALSYSAGQWYFFIDGILKGNASAVLPSTQGLAIVGTFRTGISPFIGALEEFRLSDVCRYTENFTPPTEKYELDEHTISLLHFD